MANDTFDIQKTVQEVERLLADSEDLPPALEAAVISDPKESLNVAENRADIVERFDVLLDDWTKAHPVMDSREGPLDEDLLNTLRALGYIE